KDPESVSWPASDNELLAVGASGPDGSICEFSPQTDQVAVFAPGCGIDTARPATGNPVDGASGTSQAAVLAGVTLSALRAYRPDLSPIQAETAVGGPTNRKRLDARAAFLHSGLEGVVSAADAARQPSSRLGHLPC